MSKMGLLTSRVRAYFVPFTLKELVSALAIQQAVWLASSSILYPNPSDILKELGIDDETAVEFTPTIPTYIKPTFEDRTLLEKGMSIFEAPYMTSLLVYGYRIANNVAAGGVETISLTGCQVAIPSLDNFNEAAFLQDAFALDETTITLPVSKKDFYTYILIHELGHCDFGRSAINVFTTDPDETRSREEEWSGDLNYIHFIEKTESDDAQRLHDLERFLLYFRSLNINYVLSSNSNRKHDTSLKINSYLYGEPIPSGEEIQRSRIELSDAFWQASIGLGRLEKMESRNINEIYIETVLILDYLLRNTDISLSPNARRRAELFLQSVEYFAPTLMEQTSSNPIYANPIPPALP